MERLTYRGKNGKGYVRNQGYYDKVYLNMAEVAERLTAYEDTGLEPGEILTGEELADICAGMLKLVQYQCIGTVEEFRALKEVEQKRREGCIRCERKTCETCYRFGWHPDICEKCEEQSHYSPKPFCSHCGRDLRGESHDGE